MQKETNRSLLKEKVPTETELKEIIVNYVGEKIEPENDEVTVEHVINVFAEEFPEFLLALAEENWVNGYTQALKDVEYFENRKTQENKIEE
tara:strand:- start:2177 stop:2449 length:273 start_codon:yes stop_codon:yes gene_type:complete